MLLEGKSPRQGPSHLAPSAICERGKLLGWKSSEQPRTDTAWISWIAFPAEGCATRSYRETQNSDHDPAFGEDSREIGVECAACRRNARTRFGRCRTGRVAFLLSFSRQHRRAIKK